MYQLLPQNTTVRKDGPGNPLWIPVHADNSDYQQFKIDLANGAQLSDANNNVMTADQITAFVATLP